MIGAIGPRLRRLLSVVVALLVFNAVGFVIAVAAELPAEFDGVRDPDDVLSDSVTVGSALAAPLTTLVVLSVCALLACLRSRWFAVIGLLGLIVLGTLFILGTVGEPLHPEASDPPVAFLLVWRATAVALCIMLIVVAALEAFSRLRRGGTIRPV